MPKDIRFATEISAVPLYGVGGQWCGARGICRDVSEDEHNRQFLAKHRNNERLLARITEIFRQEREPEEDADGGGGRLRSGNVGQRLPDRRFWRVDDRGEDLAMVGTCGEGSTGEPWLPPSLSGDPERRDRGYADPDQGWLVRAHGANDIRRTTDRRHSVVAEIQPSRPGVTSTSN